MVLGQALAERTLLLLGLAHPCCGDEMETEKKKERKEKKEKRKEGRLGHELEVLLLLLLLFLLLFPQQHLSRS